MSALRIDRRLAELEAQVRHAPARDLSCLSADQIERAEAILTAAGGDLALVSTEDLRYIAALPFKRTDA